MGKLTSHVLDTHSGIPAAGIRIELRELTSAGSQLLGVFVTAENGRCAEPLLQDERFRQGRYELTFYVADYFRTRNVALPERRKSKDGCQAWNSRCVMISVTRGGCHPSVKGPRNVS